MNLSYLLCLQIISNFFEIFCFFFISVDLSLDIIEIDSINIARDYCVALFVPIRNPKSIFF